MEPTTLGYKNSESKNNGDYECIDLTTQSTNSNLLVPVELDLYNHIFGYYFLDTVSLPNDGQRNIIELTGSPIQVELAKLNVFTGPILPNLEINYLSSLFNLAESIDKIDHSHHSHDTGLWVERIAKKMNLQGTEVFMLGVAGRLHDIGKSVISKDILTKPGPLTGDEWIVIRKHPLYSISLMKPAEAIKDIIPLVRSHHEWYNGTGYPDGLKGSDIPIGSRILSIADTFTTMTNGRAYKNAVSNEEALQELRKYSGRQFDPVLVDIMVDLVLFDCQKVH